VRNWRKALDLSESYTYELISNKRVRSVKVGGKRLILTSPSDFIDDGAAGG
jgi:hypothetical protein